MDGKISETYLTELSSHQTDQSQLSLSSFSENKDKDFGTTIAVVSDPIGGITEICDEYISVLGMPSSYLDEFRIKRDEIDSESPHNDAVELLNLEEKYMEHLEEHDEAKEAISQLANRVENGEHITLVCFEGREKWCHRHILQDHILNQISNSE